MSDDKWIYNGNDECAVFFTECRKRAAHLMPIEPDNHILEVGCSEFDWLTEADRCWPMTQFTGIDQRCENPGEDSQGVYRIKADILTWPSPWCLFDGVVAISTMEHIGLGHYGDPIDPEGDIVAMRRIADWVTPGGWFYFDVPYDPTGYRIYKGTKCRVYDDATILSRLWSPAWRREWIGWAPQRFVKDLILDRPTINVEPFWYVGQVWRRR